MAFNPSIRVSWRLAGSPRCLALSHMVLWSLCFATQQLAAADPLVWTASSLSRIGQSSPAADSAQIDLSAARDETYSFQIGVQAPAGGLTNVNVTTLGLTGPDSRVVADADIALFREQYMYMPSSPPYS